jgi:hypothetical protein
MGCRRTLMVATYQVFLYLSRKSDTQGWYSNTSSDYWAANASFCKHIIRVVHIPDNFSETDSRRSCKVALKYTNSPALCLYTQRSPLRHCMLQGTIAHKQFFAERALEAEAPHRRNCEWTSLDLHLYSVREAGSLHNPKGLRNRTCPTSEIQTRLRRLLKQLQREGKGKV